MTQSLPDNFRESKLKEIPLGRAGQPRDIANAVAFLASEQAGYVTGHVMEVTGGRFM
jgi:3-oxoacyl-[acyl-carrier protein] reductase